MLACLRKLAALILDFIEQPHVLDRNHRLIGKGRDQLDLLLREGLYPLRVTASTPIGAPSRNSGTPSTDRNSPASCPSDQVYSESAWTSGMWTVALSRATRPTTRPSGRHMRFST